MKRLSGPLPPRPAVTCSRRRITPFFRASAPDGVFTSGMMSGSVTWSRSCVHPWSDSSSSAARLNEPIGCRVMGRSSERDVQAERPVGGRRLGLEVADDPRRPAEVVSLRIDPRKLLQRGDGDRQQLPNPAAARSEEHTSELQSPMYLVCRPLLEKQKTIK